jgi:predicted DNA-binding protein
MPMAVRFGDDIETRLAELTGRSKTSYVREAIREKLGELEDDRRRAPSFG